MFRSWMLVVTIVLLSVGSLNFARESSSSEARFTPVPGSPQTTRPREDDADENSQEAQAKYDAVDVQFKNAIKDLRELIGAAESQDDKIRLLATQNPAPRFAKQFMEIAKKYPDTSAGLKSVMFAVQQTKGDQKNEAMHLLIERFSDQVDLVKVARSLTGEVPSQHVESWLQSMIEKIESGPGRSKIIIFYAKYVGQIPYFKRTLDMNPVIQQRYSGSQLEYIFARRTDQQNEKLAVLLQSVVDSDSGETRDSGVAKKELYDLQNLQVGMVAPEIEGKDFDDIPFKLSDYRGKVVMLDFWGHWCPPCRAMYGHEQVLAKTLADKPFVLLGVNSDRNKNVAIDALREEGLSWRHFWNGPQGRNGPISTQWNVEGWPTVYLIDQDGVIRYKGVLGDDIDRGIEQLMAEIGHEVKISE